MTRMDRNPSSTYCTVASMPPRAPVATSRETTTRIVPSGEVPPSKASVVSSIAEPTSQGMATLTAVTATAQA